MAARHGQRLWRIPVRPDGGVEEPVALLRKPVPDDDKILSISFR